MPGVDRSCGGLLEWVVSGAVERVYETSVAWAELGSDVTARPFGRLICNHRNPGYRERNCVWGLRADLVPIDVGFADSGRHFVERDLACFNYSPALGQDLTTFRTFFDARGYVDAPSQALVYTGSTPERRVAEVRLVSAEESPHLFEEVFQLSGQRFPGAAVRRAAFDVLGFDSYRSFVCLFRGRVAGRIGLLRVGAVGRVKSIFVGSEFRRLGVATAMLSAVVVEASRIGCHLVCSEVDVDNAASLALHRKVGFEPVGLMHTFVSQSRE